MPLVDWRAQLTYDPISPLLASGNIAISYFTHRDLLAEPVEPIEVLWGLPEAQRLIKKQSFDGSWRYAGKRDPRFNYDLVETFRNLAFLVEKFGFNRQHPAIRNSATYLFSCQTAAGDIRGILGNQYMPYYYGAILELLIKAGYADDPALERGFQWLLSVRQDDGGWIIPMQTAPPSEKKGSIWTAEPIPWDRSLPFSHLATGMVIRAFAAHPIYRSSPEARLAGEQLKSRLFKADYYNDRKASHYWLKFRYPFWWTDLLSVLDSLARLGFTAEDENIRKGLDWFITHQQPDGLWDTQYEKAKDREMREWVGLAVCRMLRRLNGGL